MYDSIGKAAGANARRRTNSGIMQFSPSYGVRKGFIKDPNWPPARIPDVGNATQRRHLRIKAAFLVRIHDRVFATTGDISAGGARFTLDCDVGQWVEVLVGQIAARAEVLSMVEMDKSYIYRVRFAEVAEGETVFEAVFRPNT